MSIKFLKDKNYKLEKIMRYIDKDDKYELNESYDYVIKEDGFTPIYWLNMWEKEIVSSKKKIYMFVDKKILKGFILLSLLDEEDQWDFHKKPYSIDFIFVFKKYRRKGIATKLIKQLIKNHQINSICDSEEILCTFMKTGDFILRDDKTGYVQSNNNYLNKKYKDHVKEINLTERPPDEDIIF